MNEHRSCSVKKTQFETTFDTDKLEKKGSMKKDDKKKKYKIHNKRRETKDEQKAYGDIDQEIHVT
jgi:hypothetical protein